MIDPSIYLPEWFERPGAYVLVDGQFGSTGKGLMAAWLAEYGLDKITHVTTNQGPNSGHTAYWNPRPDFKEHPELAEKIMTQQLPVASVFMQRGDRDPITLINAGAVIDDKILNAEVTKYGFRMKNLMIHPNAAVITDEDRTLDQITVGSIAGTGKGVGPAIAAKALRHGGKIAYFEYRPMLPAGFPTNKGWDNLWDWTQDVVFVETAQGFSLGINTARFYPQTTSRECTVMQAISDARIPAQMVRGVIMCCRTFPIRVGNTDNSSGGCYEDQQETTWEAIGQEPELTTVTKRVRRVFNWSRIQFREAVAANRPDVIFLNFCNYMSDSMLDALVDNILEDYGDVMGRGRGCTILGGFSPYAHDVRQLV
jgi:adenylosuccinate synthase